MPLWFRRVALLPVASAGIEPAPDCASVIEPELRKCARFEVVAVSPRQLTQWFGRGAWRADEALPAGFFKRVAAETGCDAVLFPLVTEFRAYPPLAIGWDLRLVDCADQRVWWAVDEVFDAGTPAVARSARDYAAAGMRSGGDDGHAVLQSPRRFAQYSAAAVIGTLPVR